MSAGHDVDVLLDGAEGGDHVVLGADAEAAVVGALVARGARRVLLVATARHPEGAERLAVLLGERHAGTFLTEVPQVPGEVADAALEKAQQTSADWVLAHGGGTAVGVAKAVALLAPVDAPVQVAAVPTTYAGSERTNIWGLTRDGAKQTGRDDRVRPRIVGYDPQLTRHLPRKLSLQSLLNAMAHSIDALYDAAATEAAHQAARDSLPLLWRAIRALQHDPADLDARAAATRGPWLASEALNGASMALHHKLAHVLGGSHGLPHAPTHAALLPHTLQFNLAAAPAVHEALSQAFGDDDPAAALYDQMRAAELPVSLRELELPLEALEAVVEAVMAKQYANPRPLDAHALRPFLLDLWQGRRPSRAARRLAPLASGGSHGEQLPTLLGANLSHSERVILAVHGRGANADRFAADLQRRMGDELARSTAIVALQADRCTWYPRGFRAPLADNQPQLDHALAAVEAAYQRLLVDHSPDDVVVVGFSQGACLVLTWLQTTSARPRQVLAFTGAHTPLPAERGTWRAAAHARVHLGSAVDDPWVTRDQVEETAALLRSHGAEVDLQLVDEPALRSVHAIHPPDDTALRRALES